jgi:recombinase/recombinase-like zinc beta ribbon protein/resolvase-like protein
VEQGLIAPDSYLLIENLDRLSRNKPRKAFHLLERICEAGITVVTTADGRRYDEATLDDDPMALMYALMVAIRANDESELKSDRVGKEYARKRKAAADRTENGKPFTRMLPAWLRFNEETKTHEVDRERAVLLQSIFRRADAGWGQHRIAQWLNEQGRPTWGGRGNQRRAECWHRSYVKKLLTNSAVVGTFTPYQKRKGEKRRRLDPIEDYFPAVIDRELFERVASRAQAPAARGRNASAAPASIFAGVLRCAYCGGLVTRVSKGDHVYLVCSRANRKGTKEGCKYLAVRYQDVEEALTVNAKVIIDGAPRGLETEELDAEIANLDVVADVIADQARDLADELIQEKSGAVRRRLREKETELDVMHERLRTLRARRDALARPYVQRRLTVLQEALLREPLNVVEANQALKEAVSKIVLDPEAAKLTIYWHHASEPSDGVPFFSRHFRGFDDADNASNVSAE